jgi:uncharacterized protein
LAKTLETLAQLYEVDLKIDRLKNFIDHYQENVKQFEDEKSAARKKADAAKTELDELKKQLKKRELDLEEGEEHIKKCNGRLYTVKNNKEYDGTLREIEEQKKKNSLIETDILEFFEKIEAGEAGLKAAKAASEKEAQDCENRKKDFDKKLERANQLMPEQEKARNEVVAGLAPAALELYTWNREKVGAKAVARIVDETCQCCFRIVPSQMYNEVLAGEKLLTCPNCNRILVYQTTEFLAAGFEF